MRQCSAEGNVTGSLQVGGLIGSPYDGNIISECFSAGNVTANYIAGGFTGASVVGFPGTTNSSIIENCYSRSNVIATDGVAGGFIGSFTSLLVIKNAYSTGTVSSPEKFGGFIGTAGNVVTENCYWDTLSSQLSNLVGEWAGTPGNPEITAKSTAEMKTTAMVTDLNLGSTVWTLNPAVNDSYPSFTPFDLAVNNSGKIESQVVVYPNLFDSEILIDSEQSLKGFAIYNVSGKMIQTGSLEGNHAKLNTQAIKSGLYVLIIQTETGTISKKIIK